MVEHKGIMPETARWPRWREQKCREGQWSNLGMISPACINENFTSGRYCWLPANLHLPSFLFKDKVSKSSEPVAI